MEITDQLGRNLTIPDEPQRIVSLVPSQTELLADMGLGKEIVGVTKFCVHPEGFKKSKTIIGGTKNFHFDKIRSLNPDLIIGNKEENYQEGIEALAKDFPVWVSDIYNLEDALDMMKSLGEMTSKQVEAERIINLVEYGFRRDFFYKGTVVYLIWKDPIMVAGRDTFVNCMLEKAGYTNLVDASRYPEMTVEEITALNPETVLLSSEPFPFKEKHLEDFKRRFPYANVKLVDGEMFSWYGSRLIKAPEYFERL
ncbi:ABC transporter substrate-binding protein [Litoribacter ruber]|uniref:ABC transporter substrate-binding protein n=1 Tax=Litoribacter ruber TaxID=702568 RepID=UPI001BDA7571|nr:helical backbone metal receptor [Litoribacter ruber]MBT0811351.1 ABC transporter substrate-binding protein [Litoribacter ruber]